MRHFEAVAVRAIAAFHTRTFRAIRKVWAACRPSHARELPYLTSPCIHWSYRSTVPVHWMCWGRDRGPSCERWRSNQPGRCTWAMQLMLILPGPQFRLPCARINLVSRDCRLPLDSCLFHCGHNLFIVSLLSFFMLVQRTVNDQARLRHSMFCSACILDRCLTWGCDYYPGYGYGCYSACTLERCLIWACNHDPGYGSGCFSPVDHNQSSSKVSMCEPVSECSKVLCISIQGELCGVQDCTR